ncbi:MAG: LPS assembly lipoprotein LptE [Paracoccaceae bacterium]
MSYNRPLFALWAMLLMAACGFTPVYSPDGVGTELQNQILVDEPANRDAFLLTQRIEERLGRGGNARFGLKVDITTTQAGIAINPQGDTDRYDILGVARYALRDIGTGKVVLNGSVNSFSAYSATGNAAATVAAERDARERLMVILADQIVTRLIATIDSAS